MRPTQGPVPATIGAHPSSQRPGTDSPGHHGDTPRPWGTLGDGDPAAEAAEGQRVASAPVGRVATPARPRSPARPGHRVLASAPSNRPDADARGAAVPCERRRARRGARKPGSQRPGACRPPGASGLGRAPCPPARSPRAQRSPTEPSPRPGRFNSTCPAEATAWAGFPGALGGRTAPARTSHCRPAPRGPHEPTLQALRPEGPGVPALGGRIPPQSDWAGRWPCPHTSHHRPPLPS